MESTAVGLQGYLKDIVTLGTTSGAEDPTVVIRYLWPKVHVCKWQVAINRVGRYIEVSINHTKFLWI